MDPSPTGQVGSGDQQADMNLEQTELDTARPPERSIDDAARAPIGPKRASRTSNAIDTITVVVGPLLLPAVALAVIRASGFVLSDLAFGFVAVAFAAITRAITGKGEGWILVTVVGVIVMAFEVSIGTHLDVVPDSDKLVEYAKDCRRLCDTNALQDTATRIMEESPSAIHWVVVLFFGVLLCSTAVYAIWGET